MTLVDQFNREFHAHFEAFLKGVESKKLSEAITYALSSPGKRLRPIFALESGMLADLHPQAAMLFAFSIELTHLFSLIHDDLPCLDNDDLRRGLPTVHKKFDEATALLAGDAILNFAYETFFEITPFVESRAFFTASKFFSHSVGGRGMIGGQNLELDLTAETKKFSLEQLKKIQSLKTTRLFQAAILTPMLLAGIKPGEEVFDQALDYASTFGFAFQIWDDLDDVEQDKASPDKNMALILGVEEAVNLALTQLVRSPLSSRFSATDLLRQKLEQKR